MRRNTTSILVGLAATVTMVAGLGCRGTTSDEPPVHLNPNMDWQQYYEAQERNPFFADQRAMRPPVEGTVARPVVHLSEGVEDDDRLRDDDHYYRGRDGNAEPGLPHGRLVDSLPDDERTRLTPELLDRGQERYGVFCTPCHADTGAGNGIVAQRGLQVKPPTFHSDNLRAMPLGYFYDVITHGVRTMEPYAAQIPVEDRWAIAAWVRTLQVSQSVPRDEVPEGELQNDGGTAQ